jgi:hypothetical protein
MGTMNCPFKTYLAGICGSWKTACRYIDKGIIPNAYKTKGGQRRIRKPRGATDQDIARWLSSGWMHGTNYNHSPALMRWIDEVREAVVLRPARQPRPQKERRPAAKSKLSVSPIPKHAPLWVRDAVRCLAAFNQRKPLEQMNKNDLVTLLQIVRPIRDNIAAYEDRLAALTPAPTHPA